jgi:hypothetical protein
MQETPQLEAPAVTAYPSALIDAAQLKNQGNQDLQTRNVPGLLNVATKVGTDTPEGRALVDTARDIQTRGFQFRTLTAPIENAKTEGERNLAAANALRNVSEQPLYGQALIAFMMGNKEAAFNLATGGQIKTSVEFAKDNGSIIEVRANALGQPQSYFDRGLGRLLTPEEYSQRGGSVTDFDRTLAGKNLEQNRVKYNQAFSEEKVRNRELFTAFNGINSKVDTLEKLVSNLKFGLPGDVYANLVGTLSTAQGQASTKSDSSTYLNQIQQNASAGRGQKIDAALAAKLGIPNKYLGETFSIDGKYLVSKDNSLRVSTDSLKQQTDSASLASETSKNTTSNLESVLTSESFKAAIAGKSKEEQSKIVQQMRAALTLSNEIGSTITKTIDEYGKPSFISLPTSVTFADPQSQFLIQLETMRQNRDMINAYAPYFEEVASVYDNAKTLPVPGTIGANFVNKDIFKEIRNNYADKIQQIVNTDFMNRSARQAKPAAQPTAQPAKANAPVAPPKPKEAPRPSLADLRKQAGG